MALILSREHWSNRFNQHVGAALAVMLLPVAAHAQQQTMTEVTVVGSADNAFKADKAGSPKYTEKLVDTAFAFIGKAPTVNPTNFYGSTLDHDNVRADMVTAKIEHDFSPALKLVNTTRYGKTAASTTAPMSTAPCAMSPATRSRCAPTCPAPCS